jgi:hypothetical protein
VLLEILNEGGIVAPTHIIEYMKLEELQYVFKPESLKAKEQGLQPV